MMKMLRMLKITITFLILIFSFQFSVYAYHINITPSEGNRYFKMKIYEKVKLTAEAVGWDDGIKQPISHLDINVLKWKFDNSFLKEVNSNDNSITFRAIRVGTTKLTIEGEIDAKPVTQVFFIVITPNGHVENKK